VRSAAGRTTSFTARVRHSTGTTDQVGAVPVTQAEIAAKLGILPSVASRAMALLAERGLILRCSHRYALNSAIAGYSSETESRASSGRGLVGDQLARQRRSPSCTAAAAVSSGKGQR